ncbi:hypothetical protein AOXY_G33352 [Acipenser oxyrinchus oxyrinchus]|uniref:SPIN-DOC-like zinc-finger domain-containing protein n=1 Tax=Acipenser oxyrinchus oxyrinchus TaxID=40147 RepID=A0AAD8FRY2_ACIOX|nr:hypothetical protein AOXY_G33352 [Acipenser oxyrinchus oxyrinchus]
MSEEKATAVKPPSQPAPIPEDVRMARKREYWRVKKREQRAKRAARERKGMLSKSLEPQDFMNYSQSSMTTASSPHNNTSSSSLPDAVVITQMPRNLNISPNSVHQTKLDLNACSVHPEKSTLPGTIKQELSTATGWRTRFLMDYDPQTALLVCMVCGVLQHHQSLESVRSHIAESHPHSLSLSAQDKHSILEAWDEQVSLRERFFSSQLQQGGAGTAGRGWERCAS